jgi:Mrp family chromosome partitioning ATPase
MTDYVLVDAPPVLPVTDAAILSGYASGTLLVSSIGQTKRPDFVQAIESLEKVDGQVLGLIVNRVPVRSSDAAGFMPYRYAEIDDTTRGGKPA